MAVGVTDPPKSFYSKTVGLREANRFERIFFTVPWRIIILGVPGYPES
jgi:hypothetical protein